MCDNAIIVKVPIAVLSTFLLLLEYGFRYPDTVRQIRVISSQLGRDVDCVAYASRSTCIEACMEGLLWTELAITRVSSLVTGRSRQGLHDECPFIGGGESSASWSSGTSRPKERDAYALHTKHVRNQGKLAINSDKFARVLTLVPLPMCLRMSGSIISPIYLGGKGFDARIRHSHLNPSRHGLVRQDCSDVTMVALRRICC
jgi:hypothetical protein